MLERGLMPRAAPNRVPGLFFVNLEQGLSACRAERVEMIPDDDDCNIARSMGLDAALGLRSLSAHVDD